MSKAPNIVEYAVYNLSMRIEDGYYIVTLHYPQKWKGIAPDEGSTVRVVNDDSDRTVFYYMTEVENGVDEIFNLVDETISYNKELELKAALIKEKVKELEELFISEPYDRLLLLKFVIDDPEKEVMAVLNNEVARIADEVDNERLEAAKQEEPQPTETTVTETVPPTTEPLPKTDEPLPQKEETAAPKQSAEAKAADSKIAEAIKNKQRRKR